MRFSELPREVQVVAAHALAALIAENQKVTPKKEPDELAQEVKKAFEGLYSA